MKIVMICSDMQLMLDGLRDGIRADDKIDDVITVTDGHSALQMLDLYRPDLLVLAMTDPSQSVQVARTCSTKWPQVRTLILSSDVRPAFRYVAHKYGVSEVMSTRAGLEEILDHLESIIAGKSQVRNTEVQLVERELKDSGYLPLLQAREVDREILSYVCDGLTDREIADRVYLSPQTVRNRISAMLQRCGKSNRTQLAIMYAPISSMLSKSA